jgi:hypothetical protein
VKHYEGKDAMEKEVRVPPPIEQVLERGPERHRSVRRIFKEMVGVGLASFVLLGQSYERGKESGREEGWARGEQAGWARGHMEGLQEGRWESDAVSWGIPYVSEYSLRDSSEGASVLDVKIERYSDSGTEGSKTFVEQHSGTIPLGISVAEGAKFGEGRIEIAPPPGVSVASIPSSLKNVTLFYILNPDGSGAEITFRSRRSDIAFSIDTFDSEGNAVNNSGDLERTGVREEKVEVVEVKAGKTPKAKR